MIFQNFGFNRSAIKAAAAPITTTSTTTASPYSYPAGAYAIYDFGNPSSYGGSGATVYDVSGNSNNGTLINSPTWTSTNGGRLRLDNASSQYITYDGVVSPTVSIVTIWQNYDAAFQNDTGLPTGRFATGILCGQFPDSPGRYSWTGLFNNAGGGTSFYFSYAFPASITVWHQYSTVVVSSGTSTTSTMYLDGTDDPHSETQGFDRSGADGSGTMYIGNDPVAGGRFANGYLMAYLHYNRELSGTELTNIYSTFSPRF